MDALGSPRSVVRLTLLCSLGAEPWAWEPLLVPKRCVDGQAGGECLLDLSS